ncbi:pathogenicity island protein [Staphylococcus aureus]|nr:pathogenicity island protein [Staphylococcus aureus]
MKVPCIFHLKRVLKGLFDKNGKLTLSDGKTSKVMPTNAKDKKGNDVVLVYKKVKDGFDVQVIKSSQERKLTGLNVV